MKWREQIAMEALRVVVNGMAHPDRRGRYRYKQPPPGGFPLRLLGLKANIKHGSQALMHFNVSRLQKERRREKRNAQREPGEDDGDSAFLLFSVLWLCGPVARHNNGPLSRVLTLKSSEGSLSASLWEPHESNQQLLKSKLLVGFSFKYVMTEDEDTRCNSLKRLS